MRENIRDQNGLVFPICQEKEEGDIFHQTQIPLIQNSNKYTARVLIGSRTCCLGDIYTNSNSCNYNILHLQTTMYACTNLSLPTFPHYSALLLILFWGSLRSPPPPPPPSTPLSLPPPPLTLQHVSVGIV